ncbi:MAG: hypothetical protein ABDH59_06340, partial [Fervidobacterium sp.]
MKTLAIILIFLTLVTTIFSAVIVTTTGRITAEVVSIDKTGITIRAKLGTAVFKPQDVKYVLMDETRTDLEGSVG